MGHLRSILEEDVRTRLTNVFTKKGFLVVPLPPGESNSELKMAFPLGRFKKLRGDDLDIIEFQFDKHGRPSFVINCGTVPRNGVSLPWGGYLDRDEADVSSLLGAYRLFNSPLHSGWFAPTWLSTKSDQTVRRLVDKAIRLSGEVNHWFESGTVGKHMKPFGLSRE